MKKTNIKRILLALVAVVLTFAMCFALVGCGGGDKDDDKGGKNKASSKSPEQLAEDLMEAMWEDYSASAMFKLAHEATYDEELEEEVQTALDGMKESMDSMEDYNAEVTWEILGSEDMDESDLEDYKDLYADEYDLEVEKGKVVKANMCITFEVAGEEQTSEEETEIPFLCIDGKWYVDMESTM